MQPVKQGYTEVIYITEQSANSLVSNSCKMWSVPVHTVLPAVVKSFQHPRNTWSHKPVVSDSLWQWHAAFSSAGVNSRYTQRQEEQPLKWTAMDNHGNKNVKKNLTEIILLVKSIYSVNYSVSQKYCPYYWFTVVLINSLFHSSLYIFC